jgi:hypothetical protein
LERFKARFPAIFRNFAGQTPHIRQGLSSEQFCGLRAAMNQHAVMPGHDDVEAFGSLSIAPSALAPMHGRMHPVR